MRREPALPDPVSPGSPSSAARRAVCGRCERPLPVCYCAALTALETRSRVVILQHPREQGNPIGTARMAHLCLPGSRLHVGLDWDGSEALRRACADPARPPVLLYPGPEARDVLREPPPAPVTLIVVDGTWSQARSVVRANPRLASLPRYSFAAPEPSNYRIRPAPRAAYVSTLEALMHALGAIEGDAQRFRALRRPMDAMVDAQLAAQATGRNPRPPRKRRKRTPYERLPGEIRRRYEDLVLVHGEANAWPHGTPERARGDELVCWSACRPASGATFSAIVAPRLPLAPDIPRHLGVSRAHLLAGETVEELHAAFAAFLRPDDVLASWGFHAVRLYKQSGGDLPGTYLDLRVPARLLTNRRVGSVERFAQGAGVSARPHPAEGRAARRLGLLWGLLDAWRALAPGTDGGPV